jgi:hypothetical protein
MQRVFVQGKPASKGDAPSPMLQRRGNGQEQPAAVPPIVHDVLRSPGQPLDAATRAYMEPRFGHDFGSVRVHADARAAEAAREVNALAFTVGRDVVFGAGQHRPLAAEGRRLMAHELTHVMQQAGTAPRAADAALAVGNTQQQAEGEALRAADKVVRGEAVAHRVSQARADVILRQPTTTPQAPQTDKERLQRLAAEAKKTSVGQKFLKIGGGDPKVVWGTWDYDAYYENGTITLSEAKKNVLSDCEWKQVIAMELGNFAHEAQFTPIFDDCEKGNLSEDDYVSAIEKLEFESRNEVIAAYDAGEFGSGPSRFTTMTFADYLKANKKHADSYREDWRLNCKKRYQKKHP